MARVKKKVSALAVVEIFLIVVLALVMIAMLAFNFLFKNKNTPVNVFGYSFFNTKAVTMLPNIPANTLIIAKESEVENIIEGSVILCKIGENTVLIRVREILQEEGQTYYIVKFDSAGDNEFRISPDSVIAKAVWQNSFLGTAINFASSTPGIIIAVVIPLMFIIAIQVARILSIHRLEDEAASLDDIDEFMNSRDEETPAAVTFTEPKFIEDVTGKIPKPSPVLKVERQPQAAAVEKVLSVDGRGRAEYTERKVQEKPAQQGAADNSPLFTYDRISREREQQREPAAVGAAVSRDEMYLNKPTRIEREKSAADEFFEKYAPKSEEAPDFEESEPVVFTAHLSNIIPDSIAAVQEETDSPKKQPSNFNESIKAYYEKSYAPEETGEDVPPAEIPLTIPEKAVIPKETIAPPKKVRSNKAVAELMSIIDAEETKLKK